MHDNIMANNTSSKVSTLKRALYSTSSNNATISLCAAGSAGPSGEECSVARSRYSNTTLSFPLKVGFNASFTAVETGIPLSVPSILALEAAYALLELRDPACR